MKLGEFFLRKNKLDSAAFYINKSAQFFKNNYSGSIWEALVLKDLGKLYFKEEKYQPAIEILTQAKVISEKLKNIPLRLKILEDLEANYLVIEDLTNYNLLYQQAKELSARNTELESKATNVAFNLISAEMESNYIKTVDKSAHILWISLGILGFVFLITIGIKIRETNQKKRFASIEKYLKEQEDNAEEKAKAEKPSEGKSTLNIPIETEKATLIKLEKFEKSNRFINKDVSLSLLATQMEINPRYLSEIISKHKSKNFNNYINELRIKYIVEKMKSDAAYRHYKISYLAQESGFSSHSSFTTVFKSVMGVSPIVFIDYLNEEQNNKDIK